MLVIRVASRIVYHSIVHSRIVYVWSYVWTPIPAERGGKSQEPDSGLLGDLGTRIVVRK